MKHKKIFIFSLLLVILFSFTVSTFAAINPADFDPKPEDNPLPMAENFSSILGIVQWIAIAIAVAYCIIMGVKFTIGSVDDKAEIKKHLVPFIIGVVIIYGITYFVRAIANFVK